MEIETRSSGELIIKLQEVKLRDSNVQPYIGARIDLITLMPSELSPCQRYVLMPELKKVETLRWDILEETGHVDILKLNGYIKCHYDPQYVTAGEKNEKIYESEESTTIDIIPPVCEEYTTEDYKLKIKINDGLHRCFLAYQMGVPVTVAYVRGADPRYPYYSHIVPGGWEAVEIIDKLDENYVKKFHVSKNYKKLFRNFNSQFDNIGDSRARIKINESHK